MIYQIILMRFADRVTNTDAQGLYRLQRGLATLDGIEWVRAGLQLDPNEASSFTHCTLIALRDIASLDRSSANSLYSGMVDMLARLLADQRVLEATDAYDIGPGDDSDLRVSPRWQ